MVLLKIKLNNITLQNNNKSNTCYQPAIKVGK